MPESAEIKLEYGQTYHIFHVTTEQYIGTLMPNPSKAPPDLDSIISRSLNEPVKSIPLEEKLDGIKSMLILTVDITRPSPTTLILPVLDLCQAREIEVTICIALGRHGPMTQDSLRDFLEPRVFDHYPVIQHDAFDDTIHLDFGSTSRGTPVKVNQIIQEHDFVCGLSFIEPSYLMGYSGSRKLIMPGISHHTSIDANHYWLTHPDTRIGELDRNPMHQDAMEYMKHFGFDWLTCAVLNGQDQITEVFSGDWIEAHRFACQVSGMIFQIQKQSADIVLASPGGYPYDIDLVQGKKAIVPATECVNPGGVVVLLAACPDGWGAEGAFQEWLLNKSPEQVVRDVKDRELFNLGAHGAYILAKPIVEKKANVVMITNKTMAKQLQDSYVHAVTSSEDALTLAHRLCGKSNPSYLALRNARRLIIGDHP
jgi:nickel-dependent lactate racemase